MTEPSAADKHIKTGHSFVATLITAGTLSLAVGFNLVFLYPEVTGGVIPFNDSIFHLLLAEMAADAVTHGQDVTDPWQSTIGMGFPVFHYYQHFSHVVLGISHKLTQGLFPLIDMMRWSTYLLLSVFPISIYWSVRKFGFGRLAAGMAALVASLASTQLEVRGFGFDYGSYVFRGWGLYSQLWGMILLPPTLAVAYQVLRIGQGYFCGTLLLSATLMSHLMYGYIAFVTLGALTVIHVVGLTNLRTSAAILWTMWRRLILLLLLVILVTSYFLVPFFMDQQYVDPMVNMQPAVADALGHTQVIKGLIEGELFDFQRFPSLTVLVLAGTGICLIRWREKQYLIPLSIFVLGLMLYFGKSTWGPMYDLLPMSNSLHVYRFIGLVHLGGLCLAAIALAAPWHWAISHPKQWPVTLAILSTLFLLLPVYIERQSYLSDNSQVIEQTHASLMQDEGELYDLLDALHRLPPGRTFAGEARDDRYDIGYTNLSSFLYTQGISISGNPLHQYSLISTFIPDFNSGNPEQFNLFNTRYIILPTEHEFPDFAVPLGRFGRHSLFKVETSGFFELVDSELTFGGEKSDFFPAVSSWMESELPNVNNHPAVLLGGSPHENQDVLPLSVAPEVFAKLESIAPHSLGQVVSETNYGHTYESDVIVERDSTLLLKASYHPNFRATVNGVRQKTVMLMPGFTGVELTPGHHNVHIEYQPRTLRKVLLAFGMFTLILVFLAVKKGPIMVSWLGTAAVAKVPNLAKSAKCSSRNKNRRLGDD